MIELFYNTVHSVNREDYSEEQLNAWADGMADPKTWNQSFQEHYTLVAAEETEDGEIIVGFGDIVPKTGYLDRLYVHHAFQNRGIASAICDSLEAAVTGKSITVYASITAKPFFQHRGYMVQRQQQVERNGVWLTNYVMRK